ncbi:MAG: alpha/beta hydrolase, partial [Devosiaceae bacterium]|nr:alpha/beta hydrolase [Devosiaceae bacterium]
SIPKAVVKRLPKAITGTDPEALSFLTNTRYDTKNAEAMAQKMNISMPDFNNSLENWVDFLVAKNFGNALHQMPGYFKNIGGSNSYLTGAIPNADYLLLHGLPLDSQSWQDLEDELNCNILRPDLPGHGRSGGGTPDPLPWMKSLMKTCKSRPTIIAHSIGCEYALRYGIAHPDAVSHIVLISPFFLQRQASPLMGNPTIFGTIVRLAGAAKTLKQATGLPDQKNPLITSAVTNLQRPGKVQRFANELARVSKPALRQELREILKSITVPVTIIVGENDPLLECAFHHKTHIIQKSGHYPQLTNPKQLAQIISSIDQSPLHG